MLLERMGSTVVLERPDGTTQDVARVLWRDTAVGDQTVIDVQTRTTNHGRYKGDHRTIVLAWPKDAPTELTGCHVIVAGERYAVFGSPAPPCSTPNGYHMLVTCTRSLYLYDVELGRPTYAKDAWGVTHATWEWTPAKANLLRLADTTERAAGQTDAARLVLIELEPGTWDDERPFAAFRIGSHTCHVESVEQAGEVVVLTGTREVHDG